MSSATAVVIEVPGRLRGWTLVGPGPAAAKGPADGWKGLPHHPDSARRGNGFVVRNLAQPFRAANRSNARGGGGFETARGCATVQKCGGFGPEGGPAPPPEPSAKPPPHPPGAP